MLHSTTTRSRRLVSPPLSLAIGILLAVVLAISLTTSGPKAAGASSGARIDPLTRIGQRGPATGHPISGTDPSGVPVPTGNLPGWKQVFRYDFQQKVPLGGFSGCTAGPTILRSNCSGLPQSVRSNLWAYPDGWPDGNTGKYLPSRVLSIHNGMLDYYLHTTGRVHAVAALVPKIPGAVKGNGLHYGAYAIRFRANSIPGYKVAFLLWPDSEIWPADGEIDFPEGNLDRTVDAAMHFQGGRSLISQDVYRSNATFSSWHTAVIEWTPTKCRFILDGHVLGTSVSLIPSTPMHWVLQVQTVAGAPPADRVAGHVEIAWITVYRRTAEKTSRVAER